MSLTSAKGVFPIAVTPFTPDGRVDAASVDRVTDFYVESGATGLTILGVLGEANKLDNDESAAIVRQVVGRTKVPVIVGVSSPNLAAMRSLARQSMDLGAAGVMIAPPPSLRTDDQIVNYYGLAVEAVGEDVPVVVQDYPFLTTVVMTPQVLRRIVQAYASCVMIKHEDWPGLEKLTTLRGYIADGSMRQVSMLAGNGGMFLDFEFDRGLDGAMTGYAFPDMLVELCDLAHAGRRDEAHDLFDAHLPMMRYEQQPGVGLAVRKYVLQKRGAIAFDAQRKPGSSLSAAGKSEVEYLLARLARRDPRAAL